MPSWLLSISKDGGKLYNLSGWHLPLFDYPTYFYWFIFKLKFLCWDGVPCIFCARCLVLSLCTAEKSLASFYSFPSHQVFIHTGKIPWTSSSLGWTISASPRMREILQLPKPSSQPCTRLAHLENGSPHLTFCLHKHWINALKHTIIIYCLAVSCRIIFFGEKSVN